MGGGVLFLFFEELYSGGTAQDFGNDMQWCFGLSLLIPDYINFRLLLQFSVSMMIYLSNSYFFDETKVILKNRERNTLFYYYWVLQQDQTRNAVNIQNKSSFCPKYIILCGKGRTVSLLFRDGKLRYKKITFPVMLQLWLWVLVVFNMMVVCVFNSFRFEHEKYWHVHNTFQLPEPKALYLETMVPPLVRQRQLLESKPIQSSEDQNSLVADQWASKGTTQAQPCRHQPQLCHW